jgi:hypothetical protein
MNFRNRMYNTATGTFMQPEPGRVYRDGMNLYAAYFVPGGMDPSGLIEQGDGQNVGTIDDAIKTATSVASDKGVAGMMRWGRFTAAMGGYGAYEAIVDKVGKKGSKGDRLRPQYVYTCRCGMIDMLHFYETMYIANLAGENRAVAEGVEKEKRDEKTTHSSAYSPEDITSDALGAHFGASQSWFERQSIFLEQLRSFLQQCDPVDWSKLPQEKQKCIIDWYAAKDTKTGFPVHQRKTAGSNGDPCCVCRGRDTSFPFSVDPQNPAKITGSVK